MKLPFSRPGVFALALLVASAAAGPAAAQSRFRPPPNYPQFGEPDQAQGRRILEEFRGMGLTGDFVLEFVLRVMPRRGDERHVVGVLYGTRTASGPLTRVELADGAAPGPAVERLLVQNGPRAQVWWWRADEGGGDVAPLAAGDLFAPLGGTDLTAFELQMPFLYWSDVVYEGLTRLRGRPAHTFLAYPPPEVAAVRPELAGVRFHLDTQFNALVQAEQIGERNRALRTLSVIDLKRTQDQWIVKTIDLRDETTRDKTRFRVTSAALGLALPRRAFEPAQLAQTAPAVPAERFEDLR